MGEKEKQKPRWRNIVFVAMSLAIFAFGFPHLDELFEAYVSPGLGFVLSAAAMMLILVAFGLLFGPQQGSIPADDSKGKAHPVLQALVFLVAIAAAAGWSAGAYIETNALSQPNHATSAFTVAVHLKGVVRYMTPEQYRIDQIATWTFFGCVLVLLGTVLVARARRRRRDDGS